MKNHSQQILCIAVAFLALLPLHDSHGGEPVKYAGGDGSTQKQAVIIKAPNERTGVHAEYTYLDKHYPGCQRGGQGVFGAGKRHYDRLDFTTAKGEKKVIYFDITSFYGKLD